MSGELKELAIQYQYYKSININYETNDRIKNKIAK